MSLGELGWALLAAALAVTTLVTVALYLLRRTPEPQLVSSVKFWLAAYQKSRPRFLSSWKVPWWALLVSLLIGWLIVLLIADPRFGNGQRGQRVVVLSMGETMQNEGVGGQTRWELAKAQALTLAEEITASGEIAIIGAGAVPRVITGFTRDIGTVRLALSRVRPEPSRPNLSGAVQVAESLTVREGQTRPASEVTVISDQPVEVASTRPLTVIPIRAPANTVGIVFFAARRIPAAEGEYQFDVAIDNIAASGGTVQLSVADGEEVVLDQPVALRANERTVVRGSGYSRAGANLTARLSSIDLERGADGTESDNIAYAVVEADSNRSVLLVSNGDRYLQGALETHPGLTVRTLGASAARAMPAAELRAFDTVVLDGVLPSELTNLGQARSTLLFLSTNASARAPISFAAATHPVLSGLRFNNHSVGNFAVLEGSYRESVTDDHHDSFTLMGSPEGPLAIAMDGAERRVVFGFRPQDASFRAEEIFPLMMHHTLTWLMRRDQDDSFPVTAPQMLTLRADTLVAGPAMRARRLRAGDLLAVRDAGLWQLGSSTVAARRNGATESRMNAQGRGHYRAVSAWPALSSLLGLGLFALVITEFFLLAKGRLI